MSAMDQDNYQYTNGHRIVCAANRKGSYLLLGARHWDNFMRKQYDFIFTMNQTLKHSDFEEGFIDNRNAFLTRKEAWEVARKGNQIFRLCGSQTESDLYLDSPAVKLYSENLY